LSISRLVSCGLASLPYSVSGSWRRLARAAAASRRNGQLSRSFGIPLCSACEEQARCWQLQEEEVCEPSFDDELDDVRRDFLTTWDGAWLLVHPSQFLEAVSRALSQPEPPALGRPRIGRAAPYPIRWDMEGKGVNGGGRSKGRRRRPLHMVHSPGRRPAVSWSTASSGATPTWRRRIARAHACSPAPAIQPELVM
jgi:hypothetical protein